MKKLYFFGVIAVVVLAAFSLFYLENYKSNYKSDQQFEVVHVSSPPEKIPLSWEELYDPAKCHYFNAQKHINWWCYTGSAYQILHPREWQTSGRGDEGVFIADDVTMYVDYIPMENISMRFSSATKDAIFNGDLEMPVIETAKALCDHSDSCPKFIDKKSISIDGMEGVWFHYRANGLVQEDGSSNFVDEYIVSALLQGDYYRLHLAIPSTISSAIREQRLGEFDEMIKTFDGPAPISHAEASEGEVWIVLKNNGAQCTLPKWTSDEKIEYFFDRQGIRILAHGQYNEPYGVCLACGCPRGDHPKVLVNQTDEKAVLEAIKIRNKEFEKEKIEYEEQERKKEKEKELYDILGEMKKAE